MASKPKQEITTETIRRFWLTIPSLWHNLRAHIDTVAEENFHITAEQYHSLRRISLGIDSVSALAEDKYISRSAVSRAVDLLVNKGFVSRDPHPGDRRRLQLTLTDEGQILLDTLTKQVQEWMSARFDTLDEAELVNIMRAFDSLTQAFHQERP